MSFFERIRTALEEINPHVALIISVFRVPKPLDGYSPDFGGGLYETSELTRGATDVAKSEIAIPATPLSPAVGGDWFATDVTMAYGFAMLRDAANSRPPHSMLPHADTSHTPTTVPLRGTCSSISWG